jgi:hypothetical protein
MITRIYSILPLATGLAMSFLLGACNEVAPDRATISPAQVIEEPTTCPDGQHEETSTDPDTGEVTVSCVDDPIVRPTNALSFKSDFCGCLNSKPVTYGNCSEICAGKNFEQYQNTETFFANFTVTADIALSGLGSVYGWCTALLPEETVNPKCQLEAKAADGSLTMLDVTPLSGTNSITANIQDLAKDETFILTLVETASGARSNSVQIVKFSSDIPLPILGPLKNAPISQYTCMIREYATSDTTGDVYYSHAYRIHYYFLPRIPPNPVAPGTTNLFCHDIFNPLYGSVDDALYPRLENIPGVFNLWDSSDPRFYDNNGNSNNDVNDIIIQKAKNFGTTIPSKTNFFNEFKWPGPPEASTDGSSTTTNQSLALGYFMSPWIDQTSFKSYCLNSTHYNSNNALFKALRDVISVDTEGLYIGEKAPETVTDANGNVTAGAKDFILIRETDLKQVWFYLNNGVPTAPTDQNVANVAVYFYYPLNKASPYVKTSTQRVYRVRGTNELNGVSSGGLNNSGSLSTYPPHDRKIGCVPKF